MIRREHAGLGFSGFQPDAAALGKVDAATAAHSAYTPPPPAQPYNTITLSTMPVFQSPQHPQLSCSTRAPFQAEHHVHQVLEGFGTCQPTRLVHLTHLNAVGGNGLGGRGGGMHLQCMLAQ
jgi:hypothetical protein